MGLHSYLDNCGPSDCLLKCRVLQYLSCGAQMAVGHVEFQCLFGSQVLLKCVTQWPEMKYRTSEPSNSITVRLSETRRLKTSSVNVSLRKVTLGK